MTQNISNNSGQSGIPLNPSSFGNVQKIGRLNNGRIVYRVIDSNGAEAGKLSVAPNSSDTFEKAYCDIMASAPKIQQYVMENSSEEAIKKRKKKVNTILCIGALIGGAVPIYLTRNFTKAWKQIICTIPGIIAGIGGGYAASIYATMPPGSVKFSQAAKTISKLDIQPIIEQEKNSKNV